MIDFIIRKGFTVKKLDLSKDDLRDVLEIRDKHREKN